MSLRGAPIDGDRSRLSRPGLDSGASDRQAAIVLATIAALALTGLWYPVVALIAVGAGAGYSLSGSV